jgi:PAS domain S-box-containing protein/putative nucleotidyltransferase with HDIG domain
MALKTRILVVEDENLVGRDILSMLRGLGYQVLGLVSTGEQAVQKARELAPDLVLMDVVLKGEVDGISAADTIWESLGIPVVYLTAYTDERTLQRAKMTEPFGYLLKPFEERELQTTIEMALYKSKMDKKLKERGRWLSTILNSIGDAIIATDQAGRVAFMNPVAERLTGWSEVEALNRSLPEIFQASADETAVLPADFAAAAPEVDGRVLSASSLLQVRSGPVLPVEGSLAPIRDDQGRSQGGVLVFRDITDRKRAEVDLKQGIDKFRLALEATIRAMGLTIEMRDPYTAGHQRRVSRLACAIAREMEAAPSQIDGLRAAGDIHDIGKIYIPAEILSKPGQLTDIEFTIIKTHPQVGFDILKSIDFPWPVAQIVLQHHERMNGSGYPAGLSGDEILIEARILCVADVVEAMSSHRPYRPSHGIERALEEIEGRSGQLYDPSVVRACLRLFRDKGYVLET